MKEENNFIYDGTLDTNKNNVQLRLGDAVILNKKDVTSSTFERSQLGEHFKNTKIDAVKLTCKEKAWKQIWFEIELMIDGNSITEDQFYRETLNSEEEGENEIYTENADYTFLRYIIKSGNVQVISI
ncbi:MAG: hypothetical protein ACXAAH_06580 [Promethearchaeota archaeon]|jgi:hypothetical protein